MSANSNRKLSRHPSVGKPLSGLAGLFMSACLVALMTVWATSSPFSPLSEHSNVETAYEPVSILRKVKDAFALSESVLPSPTVEPVTYEVPPNAPPALAETAIGVSEPTGAGELTELEEQHALQLDDRTAWRSFRRQGSMLVNKPVVRGMELTLRENVAEDTSDLPEVHYAAADPQPLQIQAEPSDFLEIPRLPTQLSLAIDDSSNIQQEEQPKLTPSTDPPASVVADQPPARVATLSDSLPYISPFGNQNTTGVLPSVPAEPSKMSWETGLY